MHHTSSSDEPIQASPYLSYRVDRLRAGYGASALRLRLRRGAWAFIRCGAMVFHRLDRPIRIGHGMPGRIRNEQQAYAQQRETLRQLRLRPARQHLRHLPRMRRPGPLQTKPTVSVSDTKRVALRIRVGLFRVFEIVRCGRFAHAVGAIEPAAQVHHLAPLTAERAKRGVLFVGDRESLSACGAVEGRHNQSITLLRSNPIFLDQIST